MAAREARKGKSTYKIRNWKEYNESLKQRGSITFLINEDVISKCHQCGEPCDTHENCANEACHLLFIQCKRCKEQLDNCCTIECQKINSLPFEEQKELRKGATESNKIFKKGRSESLKYKK